MPATPMASGVNILNLVGYRAARRGRWGGVMARGKMTFTVYRCKACGADLFLSREDSVAHTIDCEQTDSRLRQMARDWLAARAASGQAASPVPADQGDASAAGGGGQNE